MSLFAALETCFIVVTLLAFFLRKAILAISLGVSVPIFLHLACHDGVAILVFTVTLLPCVGLGRLE